MKRVLTAAVLIPLVLLAVLKAPTWLFALLVGVITLLAVAEYLTLAEAYGAKTFRPITLTVAAACFLPMAPPNHYLNYFLDVLAIVLFILPMLMLTIGMAREDLRSSLPGAAASWLAFPYVVLPMISLVVIKSYGDAWFWLFFLFFIVWAGDIVALYVGRRFGRRKMAPRISPNKTWEGAAGSVAGSLVVALLLSAGAGRMQGLFIDLKLLPSGGPRLQAAPLLVTLGLAVALNVAAQLGDLVESMIKRGAGVKDSGSLLPGHGGVLDRIDALLFAAPVAVILFLFAHNYFVAS